MDDQTLLIVGIVVFGMMLTGIILTIVEFRKMPNRQPPQFEDVAFQAQPDPPKNRSSTT